MKKQAKKYKLNLQFHTVTKHENPIKGCLESHLQLIKQAKQNNLEYVAILEDDAKFIRKPEFTLPKDFVLFYLGGSIKSIDSCDNTCNKALEVWSTHAYVLHSNSFDRVINDLEMYDGPIDQYYVSLQKEGNCYVVKPLITTQKSGYSDIEGRNVNYDVTTVNEEPYQEALHKSNGDQYQLILNPVDVLPTVSIITPTRDRPHFVSLMINNFNSIKYPKEKLQWIIVDDGKSLANILPDDKRIQYIHRQVVEPLTVGRKRNIACSYATGDFIVHMDDDDFYPQDSVDNRIRALLTNNKDCVGSTYLGCMNLRNFECYGIGSKHSVLAEASMAYRRSFWETKQFRDDVYTGEAVHFLKNREHRVIQIPYDYNLIAFSHGKNITESLREQQGEKNALMPLLSRFGQRFVHLMNKYLLKN